MDIKGKTALVTGASSGMGAAIAIELAKGGAAKLLLLARNQEKLENIARQIVSHGSQAYVYPIDLSQDHEVEQLAQRILHEVGVPDILVNNAGSGQWKFIEETSAAEARNMMDLPYFAAFNLTRAFLPGMLARNSGHIVNMSSVASRFTWPGATAYTAARWAVRGLTEALRSDLYGTNINVTLYESGYVQSPYWEHNPNSQERLPGISHYTPPLTPADVGQAVVAAVRHDKRLVVIPFMMKTIYLQHFFFPWVVQWLMNVTGYRRKGIRTAAKVAI